VGTDSKRIKGGADCQFVSGMSARICNNESVNGVK